MPKQYVVLGRPLPRIGRRRLSVFLVGISLFAVFSLLFTLPSAIPTGPSLQLADHKFSIPKSLKAPWMKTFNPFRQPSHPPPAQKNDTYGESHWFANWRWLSVPFSSSITLDENRSLLPVPRDRPPIYCYYDHTIEKDALSMDAESDLLLTWRRAWWAQGFKPVILSPAEAMNNPVYEELQQLKADPALKLNATLETDVMRWLAWENMGGGLLASYLLFPMGSYADPLLTYLRRGEYPQLTRWKNLDSGLFSGPKAEITEAIKLAMSSTAMKSGAHDFVEAIGSVAGGKDTKTFAIDDDAKSLAYYDAAVIEKKYSQVADALLASRGKGLADLNQLVTSHLHLAWQRTFSGGISVLKPLPHHTTHMISPAYEIASRLAHCPESPLPASCPPNMPKCSPCVASQPMKIGTPPVYRNSSTQYVIGTVPHPYTIATVSHMKDRLDVPWIRRTSVRDAWVTALTKELLGTGVSSAPRVLRFKEAVASETYGARSLWLPAEDSVPSDLDWHFGFVVPSEETWVEDGKSETPVPGPERRLPPPTDPMDGPVAKPDELAQEPELLEKARDMVHNAPTAEEAQLREVVEAWNLADTEAWRFARAYLARETMERKKWEEQEAKYAGGAGSEKGRKAVGWGRWLDGQTKRWSDQDD